MTNTSVKTNVLSLKICILYHKLICDEFLNEPKYFVHLYLTTCILLLKMFQAFFYT
jgi:hypothetical protein